MESACRTLALPLADEAFAFPLSGLACNGCKTSQRCGLFVHKAAELGHRGDELANATTSDALG